MAAKILLGFLLLACVLEAAWSCKKKKLPLCPVVKNTNCLCKGKAVHQCVCDFTCSEWDKPCNWVVTCKEEIERINDHRDCKGKLRLIRQEDLSHSECLEVNVQSHNHTNCCNYFCEQTIKDVCF